MSSWIPGRLWAPRLALAACLATMMLACGSAPPKVDKTAANHRHQVKDFKRYDAQTFYNNVAYSGASFSSDETRILLSSDATGIVNVYAQPVAGGEPTPLTTSTVESMYGVSYFPGDDRFLYFADQGGNELDHVYVVETDGTTRDLTPGDKLKASFMDWSGDKQSFWLLSNERDPKSFDLYRYAVAGYQRELVLQVTPEYAISDVSPDGRYVATTRTINNADADVYLFDMQAKKVAPMNITTHKGNVNNQVMTFSRDSKKLYYSSDGYGEFRQVWSYELQGGARKAEIVADWDVMYVGFSETGRYRVSATNVDARTVLQVIDTQTGEEVKVNGLPAGDITGVSFSRSETRMALYLDSNRSPRDLFVVDLTTGAASQLTRSLQAAIDPRHLVDGEVVRYASFDGREIPAILYRPHQASPDARVPALVMVHGGPGGQSRIGYSAMVQHLVNQGYGILAVNNRGSSGYGKTFYHLDDRNHGEGDLDDCVHGRKYLESLDWVTSDKIGIIGGSYGGYMVLAALAFRPEAFNVGVDIFGVANWLRTLESVPPWWASFRDALYAELGDPATDRERLERISPLFHAGNIKKPLLVIQGANDPRVLKVESDEIVAAVKKSGVPVEYVVFDDEGHGFVKKANRIAASQAFVEFLGKYLR